MESFSLTVEYEAENLCDTVQGSCAWRQLGRQMLEFSHMAHHGLEMLEWCFYSGDDYLIVLHIYILLVCFLVCLGDMRLPAQPIISRCFPKERMGSLSLERVLPNSRSKSLFLVTSSKPFMLATTINYFHLTKCLTNFLLLLISHSLLRIPYTFDFLYYFTFKNAIHSIQKTVTSYWRIPWSLFYHFLSKLCMYFFLLVEVYIVWDPMFPWGPFPVSILSLALATYSFSALSCLCKISLKRCSCPNSLTNSYLLQKISSDVSCLWHYYFFLGFCLVMWATTANRRSVCLHVLHLLNAWETKPSSQN